MPALWTSLIVAVLIQESALITAVFVAAQQDHIAVWIIHLLWAAATVLDMYLGYWLGLFVKHHSRHTRFHAWTDQWAGHVRRFLGHHGEALWIGILAIADFPYVNTFIAAWIGIPRKTSFIATFLGNLVWYVLIWGAILGVRTLTINPYWAVPVIIGLGIAAHFITKNLSPK
jgi:membrane protein YqaA with SNARE-associated domain